ncbi:hypothetical protein ASD44_14985 [Mesorhizobium sp. Root554]|uniref:type II toxin-antitoxin system RelE/ParE family toxin n=1 Tax=unclassified Mesorhizobium TaxID=325217 RepID=UPI0006F3A8DB|nr:MULTISPECIES: type II toxin-antitoxin system RelE/ParE family toxin [unclassified Mesorhizobium]KQZ15213.1 hypothetical protein ASD27_14990 [Mesorhizobium sp. Root1471]KQZ37722.1 hypothetical protein ASD44_14985 [Mesorhizobium sp. Root554]
MPRVGWSRDALDDLDEAIAHIGFDAPKSAHLVLDRIEAAVDLLAETPAGRMGRVSGTHEWHVRQTPYIIAYSLTDETLNILRVIHGARDWPEGEWRAE